MLRLILLVMLLLPFRGWLTLSVKVPSWSTELSGDVYVTAPVYRTQHSQCITTINVKKLSSEVISLKWWGGPSSKNGVTWPRFVRSASAFCLVSSQKWSVLFFYVWFIALTPCFKLTKFFLHWYLLFYYQRLHYIVKSDRVTWPRQL